MSRIYYFLIVFVSLTLLVANQANPPNGKTGAPGEGSCLDCHTFNNQNQDGIITLAGLPATIVPSMAYLLTVTVNNPNGNGDLAGFQVTILNSSNQKAGTMSSPSPSSTLQTSGARQYWEHNPAQQYPGNNMVSWTVNWVAPTGPSNTTITAYAAGNVAKDNNNDSNDLIIFSTAAGTLQGGADPLQVDIVNQTNVFCNGGNNGTATAGAINGTPPYAYSWSTGANMATISNLTAGLYFVTVTDMANSTATTSVVISQPTVLNLQNPTINHVSCFGGNNGSIQASATGGTTPYSFSWSNGSSGSFISGLVAGSYTVTVTDDHACTKTATYQVNQPTTIAIQLVSLTHETCSGDGDGAITISSSGGTGQLSAAWSNGLSGNAINGLAPGTYIVTVTDNNNCTKTSSYTVNPGSVVTVALEDLQHVTCNGGNNGFISVHGTGGTAPYIYVWSNGGTGPMISNLTTGSYTVTATDNNGCVMVKAYTVTQPGAITIQINTSGVNGCSDDSSVDLTAVVGSGAQQPVTAVWSNGAQGLINNDLAAGTYTITITDFGGCTAIASKTVTSPTPLVVTVSTTDETAAGANDGTAEVSVSGGTGGYIYTWSNGNSTDSIGGLAPGIYSVTVVDQNDCTASGTGQVDESGCMVNIDLGPDVSICEGETAMLSLPPGFASYLWSTGETSQSIIASSSGMYCATVVDVDGCADDDCVVMTEQIIVITIDTVIDITIQAGSIEISVNGGSAPYSYNWTFPDSTNSTDEDLSILTMQGLYTVVVTDANGCETSANVMVDNHVAIGPAPVFKPIKVYPVPTTEILHVEIENEITEALIMGMDGRMYKRILNPASNNLQVGELEPGWYILRITDGQSWFIARIIK